MTVPLDRAESIRLAKAHIISHRKDALSAALSDPSCPSTRLLAALLHASGYFFVGMTVAGAAEEFFAGPTEQTASLQLRFHTTTGQLSGGAAGLLDKVYLVLTALEHDLDAAVYLPPDMRRDRVAAVCKRLGIEEDFFRMVLRNQAA